MKNKRQIFLESCDGYHEVVEVARFTRQYLHDTYKRLVANVFDEPVFYEKYSSALQEYARWAKAALYRRVVRDYLLGEKKNDEGHDQAIRATEEACHRLREHAQSLRSVHEEPDSSGAVEHCESEKATAAYPVVLQVEDVDILLQEAIDKNAELFYTCLHDLLAQRGSRDSSLEFYASAGLLGDYLERNNIDVQPLLPQIECPPRSILKFVTLKSVSETCE